jgi:hypothetical protein
MAQDVVFDMANLSKKQNLLTFIVHGGSDVSSINQKLHASDASGVVPPKLKENCNYYS